MLFSLKLKKVIMICISLLIAWGLKYHYSTSTSDDLVWILAPTAYLAELTGDMTFEKETGVGYVNKESGIIIAPSCSGVNFMIIAFCLSAYIGLKKMLTTPVQLLWIMASIVSSYVYTLLVNTFRIGLSIYSIRTGFLQTWFSGETVHLLEGVLVYFIFLLVYNYLLNRIINTDPGKISCGPFMQVKKFILPLSFYLSFTLLVPVLSYGGVPPNKDFTEFAFIVLISCFVVIMLFFLLKACCHYIAVRVK
ncbi:MAG: exosortase K [Deltaproteobacteria bacterium]|nr:exosortase K [Deltaproteobacteria bacterium]